MKDYRERLVEAVQAFIDASNELENLAYEDGDAWNDLIENYPFEHCFHDMSYIIRDMSVRETTSVPGKTLVLM